MFFTAILLRLVLPLAATPVQAQDKVNELRYTVIHNDRPIGSMTVSRACREDSCTYRMSTRIDTRFIIPIHSSSDEESALVNGVISHSYLLRDQNGIKTRKTMVAGRQSYVMTIDGESRDLGHMPAYPPSLTLYHEEPRSTTFRWSDNYVRQLPVTPEKSNTWKVEFPDGSYSYYHYENGIASRIEVFHPFFPVTFLLDKQH